MRVNDIDMASSVNDFISVLKDVSSLDTQDLETVQSLIDLLEATENYISAEVGIMQDYVQTLSNLL